MNKILLNNFPYPNQNVTFGQVKNKNKTINIIHGYENHLYNKVEVRKNLIPSILSSLLIHEKLCLSADRVLDFIQLFGLEDTITLTRYNCIEFIGDNGFNAVLKQKKTKYETFF
jgi:hypothetical protein